MKVIITSATSNEVFPVKQKVIAESYKDLRISFHTSGVGILRTCYSLTKLAAEHKPDLIIQAGIAGCFDKAVALGEVFAVKEEFIGDTGVEENGMFQDVFDMKFEDENTFPYTKRSLANPQLSRYNLLKLEEVAALSISEISTRPERIEQLKNKYKPVIESMEGAALHYVGLQENIAFIQIRAISNYVGERDKSKWDFKTALYNLCNNVLRYLDVLQQSKL